VIIDFNTDYILENDRVRMNPIMASDLQYLQHFVMDEPELWKYSLVSPTVIGMDGYIQVALNGRQNEKEYAFIVFDKLHQKYAGSTRFYDIQPAADTVQLGFTWYGKHFQGTGLNKNCKYLMLEFAFEKMMAKRVEFRADNDNARSIAAMKSIGCTVEGILRSNGYTASGQRRDSIVLSILENEWNAIKANLEFKIKTNI
jgi:RimJ/RimL family protein N-acetyltransferase